MSLNLLSGEAFNLTTLIVSGLALVAAIVGIRYSRSALFPGKRELRVQWVKPAPLIGKSSTDRISLLVEVNNRVLETPYLTHVEILVTGRYDIKSSDFDQGQPLVLDFGTLAALASIQFTSAEIVSAEGTKVLVRPTLLKRGAGISFDVITEGSPEVTLASDHIADTKVIPAERPSAAAFWRNQFRQALAACIAFALLGVFGIGLSYWETYQYHQSSERLLQLSRRIMELCGA
ncbi:hypothetical protein [Micromonospora sp. NPDC004551]|uniref:hypothetical protein n=1 Tax=Micromonospora sp. NPDC004551 TaxID=3154284 RepID=UPI0033A1930C